MRKIDAADIDALLPQTQCGLCGYGGCLPYAIAIAHDQAALNLCPPGGVTTLLKLGEQLNEDVSMLVPDMQAKEKPQAKVKIQEENCIGCTKCIQACPVDAIIGAAKQMHVIIQTDCTGCALCLPACPVDCIDLLPEKTISSISNEQSNYYRKLFQKREQRLQKEKQKKQFAKTIQTRQEKQNYLKAALARAKDKKCEQQK